jgi:tetratricopeptide (TPR) repeat protein
MSYSPLAATVAPLIMPSKSGRNDPCPCGSGKKYKHCCLEKDQAAEHENFARAAAAAAEAAATEQQDMEDRVKALDEAHELAVASNAVIDLIDDGKLDEAEQAARELLVRYPDVHDGYDRLGMVYEARGQNKQAADYYRQVIEFVRAHPEQYDSDFTTTFEQLIADLDPAKR